MWLVTTKNDVSQLKWNRACAPCTFRHVMLLIHIWFHNLYQLLHNHTINCPQWRNRPHLPSSDINEQTWNDMKAPWQRVTKLRSSWLFEPIQSGAFIDLNGSLKARGWVYQLQPPLCKWLQWLFLSLFFPTKSPTHCAFFPLYRLLF